MRIYILLHILVIFAILLLAFVSWRRDVYIKETLTQSKELKSTNSPSSEAVIQLPDVNITIVPTLKKGKNGGIVTRGCPNINTSSKKHLIIVTNAVYTKHGKYTNKYYKNTDPIILELRWFEMMSTLQANLNHPSVKNVIVFVEHKEVEDLLQRYDFGNSDKLVIYNVERDVEMSDLIDYATKCFQDEVIAITNLDMKFGPGWEKLDYQHLTNHKHMYCLTKHSSVSHCSNTIDYGVCDPGIKYIGFHHAYIFHVKEHLHYNEFPELRKRMFNANGIENLVISTFRDKLGFVVTNPCKILLLHHENCVLIENPNPVNTFLNRSNIADFTNTFY